MARFALAPDMVRSPAWWDEVGQEPALQAVSRPPAPPQKVRVEQTEFWNSAGKPTALPTRAPRRESTPVPSVPAATARLAPVRLESSTLYPPNDHDRPSASPSGVGDAQDARAPMRPVVATYRKANPEAATPVPRVSMARYLRLNGMLQSGQELRDGMELPRRDFRARLKFLAERHLPLDPSSGCGGQAARLRRNAG